MAAGWRRFAQRQAEAIGGDAALRRYGALLALVHPLTAWAWLDRSVGPPVPEALAPGQLAICWPFFPSCGEHRLFDPTALHVLLLVYGALGLVCAALWLGGLARRAWALHLGLEVLTVAVVMQDYRLRLNEHYMAVLTVLAFLLLPSKRDTVRVLLVAFYVAAGLLKLTPDWLSGRALPTQPLFVPESMTSAACLYVVVLELVIVWGLLAQRPRLFWAALMQVALFHLTSYSVVGYYYPLLMVLLLSVFPLVRWAESPAGASSLLVRTFRGGLPGPSFAFLALFAALQVVPHLYPGDTGLTGEGRWMALHMFDARTQCRGALRVRAKQGALRREDVPLRESVRIHCDPLVVRAVAEQRCRELQADPDFDSFDLVLETRHATEKAFHRLIDQPRFCPDVPAYAALGHNDWIRLQASPSP